jgi:hypothetical protein
MKKIINLVLLIIFILSFVLNDFCLASDIDDADKFYKDRLDWAYKAYELQFMQHTTPEAETKKRKGAYNIWGALLSLSGLATVISPAGNNINWPLSLGLGISGITTLLYGRSLLQRYERKKQAWDDLYKEGLAKGYITPGKIKVGNIIKPGNTKVILYESFYGALGPLWVTIEVFSRLEDDEDEYEESVNALSVKREIESEDEKTHGTWDHIAFLGFSIVLFPFSVPYGVSESAEEYYQGGTYVSALRGSLVSSILLFLLLKADGNFTLADFGLCYLGTVAGSVYMYNREKPKPYAEIIISKNVIVPKICLTRNPFNNQLMINAQLMNIKF